MLDTLYTFIATYPASLPIFFLIVCTAALIGTMVYDNHKAKQ